MPPADPIDGHRSGYVALVGRPNVGKSTLLNAFVGVKLSIITPKPQTTRNSILGILNEPGLQAVFVDTPGWLEPHDTLQSHMKKAILRSLYDDADLIVWLLEPQKPQPEDLSFGQALFKTGKQILIGVNKIDTLKENRELVLDSIRLELEPLLPPDAPLYGISAKGGEGVTALKKELIARLPQSPPYFPADQLTDRWERFYVAELIREQIFKANQQEVPHASCVVIDEFQGREGRKDFIKAHIYVETEGQKNILVGKRGMAIRNLGQRSRQEIELQLGRPVYLELMIKVHKNWRKDPNFLKSKLSL